MKKSKKNKPLSISEERKQHYSNLFDEDWKHTIL